MERSTGNGHGNGERRRATVLAIGTTNPEHFILQEDYPDFYFKNTNNEHMTDLKEKFDYICERSTIRKRHFYLTEEIVKANPAIATYGAGSSMPARVLV